MAINYPGPYELRLFYTVNVASLVLTHSQRLSLRCQEPVSPGDLFNVINVVQRDDTVDTLLNVTDAWVALMRPFWNTNGTIVSAELWKYAPGTFDADFISAYTIGLAGTSANPPVAAGEVIFTFRTTEGGIMKVALQETFLTPGIPRAFTGMTAAEQALVQYIVASNAPFVARDTSYPFVILRDFPGSNEKSFNRRYRDI